MKHRGDLRGRGRRDGFAMLIVLLTLMALLVLCTPFLMTVRNADQASAQSADRMSLELALDAAGRIASGRLGESHSALDVTPDFDSLAELRLGNRFADPLFLDPNDPRGVMFDLEVHDVSGRIDLNSAPPQVVANAIGAIGLTLASVAPDADEIPLTSAAGFQDAGFVWVAGELIGFARKDGNALKGLVRALAVELDDEGKVPPCGPRPARVFAANTVVIDQRAWVLPQWRSWVPGGEPRRLDALERLVDLEDLIMADGLGPEAYDALARTGTVYAGIGAGPEWQHPSRVRNQLKAGIDCTLELQDARWFNEGTTVRITDGETTELGIVRRAGGGSITLVDAVGSDYAAYTAVVQPLARRPVNVNTATREVLVALLLNLQMRGRQSRVTPREADQLALVIEQSRPFTSFEDFVRRLILPAAGWKTLPADAPVVPERFKLADGAKGAEAAAALKFIDEDDARAIYKNALNANDGELAFSTMPFAFTSTDTHHMELRAAVNAPSGVERAHGMREQVENVVPQRDLMFLATRQEDFEQLFRLDCDAPGWATGPMATSRFDSGYGSSPPTRSRAHLAIHDTMPSDDPLTDAVDYVFAERDPAADDVGYALPWVAREEESGRKAGRMLHFDDEAKSLEGRHLPDQTVVQAASDTTVGWLTGDGLMRPFSFSMWLKPAELEQGALFLDCGGSYSDSDRVSLAIEDGYLVLKVLDGAGDHPDTPFEEIAQARYQLGAGDGPGMPLDTWIHVSADVRGSRPDQIVLLVDERWNAEVLGLTKLKSALGENDAVITVESTEGFPERCVLRIGEELIEAVVSGGTTFSAVYASEGENAGFGGRLARSKFSGVDGEEVPVDLAIAAAYDAGTPVELYGYALLIDGNVSNGEGQLASDIGRFAVGLVSGMADDPPYDGMQPILMQLVTGGLFPLGVGMENQTEAVLELASADPAMPVAQTMAAFDPNGGYAALVSVTSSFTISPVDPTQPGTTGSQTADGHDVGGIEVVHYSGWEDNRLTIDRRGDAVGLPNLKGVLDLTEKKAWVLDWNDNLTIGSTGVGPDQRHTWHTKIFPISLHVSGAGSLDALADGESNSAANPRFAQITHLGAESGLTEWVRYDFNSGDELVRDDPAALLEARSAAQADVLEEDARGSTGGGPTGGGTGGGGAGGGGPTPPAGLELDPPPAPPSTPPGPAAVDGAQWHYRIGEEELDAGYVVSRAVKSRFQFRGVLGTYDHDHPQGTAVLPTWWTGDRQDVEAGRPGRFDAITLIDTLPSDPGFPGTVQHAHRPQSYTAWSWQEGADGLTPEAAGTPTELPQAPLVRSRIYVGLQDAVAVPIAGGSEFLVEGEVLYESRLYTRASKFPSGELPRAVTTVSIGGSYASTAGVPAATVDEILFGNTDFLSGAGSEGAQLKLSARLAETGDAFDVFPNSYRIPLGSIGEPDGNFLSGWPAAGGLVRIGEEVICYQGYDASSGVVAIAEGGRGLLGTEPQPHAAGEPVSILQHIPVSVLTGGLSAEDPYIQLASLQDFPSEGLLWIEDELIHYTRQEGGAVSMPRASGEPGRMDRKGPGLFRGRFGTTPAAHGVGVPVILHPFRFWDRWTDRADAPELHYLGASVSQPAAFWRTMFFDVEQADQNGPRLGVVQRTDSSVPWDADPDAEPALDVIYDGLRDGKGVAIGTQSDRLEWRVFVRWERGSYDPAEGLLHGWKMAPRLRFLGAEYFAPSRMLRRVAR
jgi:hypothetical protein